MRQGYGHMSLIQIADESGVAVETIYAAFRNKATLLRKAWYLAGRGDEQDLTLYARPEMQDILAESDIHQLTCLSHGAPPGERTPGPPGADRPNSPPHATP